MSEKELMERVLISEQNIKNGEVIDLEEWVEEIKKE